MQSQPVVETVFSPAQMALANTPSSGFESLPAVVKQMREVERFVSRRRTELAAVDQRIFALRKSTLTVAS